MRKNQAMKLKVGDRVKYKHAPPPGKPGTIREVKPEFPDPRVKTPIFRIDFDDGETFDVTYLLLERED